MSLALSLALGLLQVASAPSAQDQADFAAANEKSLAGDTTGAIALYEDLVTRGLSNEDVLFNLGNSYAQAGRLVDAAVAYERALRLVPFDHDVAENLRRVRARLHPNVEPRRIEQPVEAVEQIVARAPPRPARIGFVIAVSAFFLAWFLRRQSGPRWLRRVLGFIAGLGSIIGLTLGLVLAGQEWVRLDERGVVLSDVVLRAGPDARFGEAGPARAGARARILEEDASWSKIQTDEGIAGWLESSQLHPIDRDISAR